MRRQLVAVAVLVGFAGLLPAADNPKVQKLIDVLKDPDKADSTKQGAINDLGVIGPAAAPALPLLKPLLKHPKFCNPTMTTVIKIGKAGVPLLLELVEEPLAHKLPLAQDLPADERKKAERELKMQFDRREWAISGLGTIGQDASSAAKPLLAITKADLYELPTRESSVRHKLAAARALGTVATDDTAKEVAVRLGEMLGEKEYAESAIRGLLNMRGRAKAATPAVVAMLEKYLKKELGPLFPGQVDQGILVLKSIGPDAAEALPVLRQFLKEPSYDRPAQEAIEAIKAKK